MSAETWTITAHAVERYVERVNPSLAEDMECARTKLTAIASLAVFGGMAAEGELWYHGDTCFIAKRDGAALVCVTVIHIRDRASRELRPGSAAARVWKSLKERLEGEVNREAKAARHRAVEAEHARNREGKAERTAKKAAKMWEERWLQEMEKRYVGNT